MYAEDKYTLRPKPKKGDDKYLDGYGKHWGEKLTFTIGVSYCGAAGLGFLRALTKVNPTMKYGVGEALMSTMSTIGRTTAEFGNGGASATLMYCLIGGFLDLVFEEEIKEFGFMSRNIMAGGITGALYKSTLGFRPMIVGMALGAGTIAGLTYVTNALFDKGWIKFKIEV